MPPSLELSRRASPREATLSRRAYAEDSGPAYVRLRARYPTALRFAAQVSRDEIISVAGASLMSYASMVQSPAGLGAGVCTVAYGVTRGFGRDAATYAVAPQQGGMAGPPPRAPWSWTRSCGAGTIAECLGTTWVLSAKFDGLAPLELGGWALFAAGAWVVDRSCARVLRNGQLAVDSVDCDIEVLDGLNQPAPLWRGHGAPFALATASGVLLGTPGGLELALGERVAASLVLLSIGANIETIASVLGNTFGHARRIDRNFLVAPVLIAAASSFAASQTPNRDSVHTLELLRIVFYLLAGLSAPLLSRHAALDEPP